MKTCTMQCKSPSSIFEKEITTALQTKVDSKLLRRVTDAFVFTGIVESGKPDEILKSIAGFTGGKGLQCEVVYHHTFPKNL